MDKLLDDLHPSIKLIEGQDVLLSEETQARAFPEVLESGVNEETMFRIKLKTL